VCDAKAVWAWHVWLDEARTSLACIGCTVSSHCHPWHDHRPTNFKRHHCWQIMKDTIHQTLLPMWYINLKTCATNNPNRKILTSDLELNPGHICYCCQVVHIKSNFSLPSFIGLNNNNNNNNNNFTSCHVIDKSAVICKQQSVLFIVTFFLKISVQQNIITL